MKHQITKCLIGTLGLATHLTTSQQASARTWYNFPSEAKVKITRDPNGQSWIYLEFLWGKMGVPQEEQKCKPNFKKGQAVEFEVIITPKCFFRPAGGKDDRFDCRQVMGPLYNGYYLPDDSIPGVGKNCYVDVWNYWIPSPDEVVDTLQRECGLDDKDGQHCAWWATALGAFKENTGNFAVGLHDASALKAGERYSFRYPVEINDSFECQLNAYNFHSELAKRCVSGTSEDLMADTVWEDPTLGYMVKRPFYQDYTVHNEWGRVQITMQTFNNHCDLGPGCDSVAKAYTCPHLIGAVNGSDSDCIDADKETDFWISRLCVPTDDFKFTPGYGVELSTYEQSAECITEQNSSDLYTHNACCIDMDGDGFYGHTGKLDAGSYVPVEVYGHQTGDCDDTNSGIHPNATEICLDGKDNNCDGINGCFLGPPIACPTNSECFPGDEMMATCANSADTEHKVCDDSCHWAIISECPSDNPCPPGQTTCGTGTCITLEGNPQHCNGCGNTCGPNEICSANGCTSACDCTNASLPCCDGCNYKSSSTTCNSWTEYRCQGTSPGQDAQYMDVEQHCTGYSTSCTGENTDSGWLTYDNCSSSEKCVMSGTMPQCVLSCTDTYVASATESCYSGNPSSTEICLNLQQVSGSTWKYRICKGSGTFQNNVDYEIIDLKHSSQYLSSGTGGQGSSCTPWKNISMSYITGYGSTNGASLRGQLYSPSGCTQATCFFRSSLIPLNLECQ